MNCTDVTTIMDEHHDAMLTVAERTAVDIHLLGCADCAAAWLAHTELSAITMPTMSPALLDSVLGAVRLRTRPTHSARRGVIVSTALLAGAVFATVGVMQLQNPTLDDPATASAPALSVPTAGSAPAAVTDNRTSAARGAGSLPVDTAAIALTIVPVVRIPPDYPPDALKRGLEGSVTLRFDVTATGVVENAIVINSTDTVFDAAALAALTEWRYLPRLAAGKRVASKNVETMIRFQLDKPGSPPPLVPRPVSTTDTYLKADEQTFAATMKATLDNTAADDFRGAELVLDELRARYELSGFQEANVWDVYAYLYLVQGNYDRAIDAYESGIAAYARAGIPWQTSAVALANLYFARHQYAEALRTLLKHKQNVARTQISAGQPNPIVEGFIDRLRALGVTEETLPAGR